MGGPAEPTAPHRSSEYAQQLETLTLKAPQFHDLSAIYIIEYYLLYIYHAYREGTTYPYILIVRGEAHAGAVLLP